MCQRHRRMMPILAILSVVLCTTNEAAGQAGTGSSNSGSTGRSSAGGGFSGTTGSSRGASVLGSSGSFTGQTTGGANVLGNMLVAKAAVPHLKKRGGGSIVLIGSQSMWLPPAMPQIAYAAAKGALVAAMKHMVTELGPDRIRVNMVVPTYMWGPPVEMYVDWQAKERGVDRQAVIDEIAARMPLGEIPADEDVAEACVFFCSDRSRMITGETLLVNAGEMMH